MSVEMRKLRKRRLIDDEKPLKLLGLDIGYPTGASHFEDKSDVAQARLVFEHVSAKAMSHDESVALIERMLA
ncbi:MAG: hypothetical protein ABWY11_21020 [Umezawaea sp.]